MVDQTNPLPPYGHKVVPLLNVRRLEQSIQYYQKIGVDHIDTYIYGDLKIADLRYKSTGYQDVKTSLHEYPLQQFPNGSLLQKIKLGLATPNIPAYKYLVEQLRVNVFGARFLSEHEALLSIQDPDCNQIDRYIKD